MCPAGLLRRRMKPDIADVNSRSGRNAERLNTAIQVLVVQRVFIVPDSGRRMTHFETHEPNTIVTVIRFDLIHSRAGPGLYGWLFTYRAADGTETKRLINSTHVVLLV